MSCEAPLESPSVFSEWSSQLTWGLATGCSQELCPVLGTEQETTTLCSQVLLLPDLLQIPVVLVLVTDLASGLIFMALVCLKCVRGSW